MFEQELGRPESPASKEEWHCVHTTPHLSTPQSRVAGSRIVHSNSGDRVPTPGNPFGNRPITDGTDTSGGEHSSSCPAVRSDEVGLRM